MLIFSLWRSTGADEETAGHPLLALRGFADENISCDGINRDKVYIGNILTWRPRHPGIWKPTSNS